jgi:predicted Zn-dependent protease
MHASASRYAKTSKLTALTTAARSRLRRCADGGAWPGEQGPPVLRDTETEQLLREYTRPILRAAGLEKQNIQMVIINESASTPSSPTAAASS